MFLVSYWCIIIVYHCFLLQFITAMVAMMLTLGLRWWQWWPTQGIYRLKASKDPQRIIRKVMESMMLCRLKMIETSKTWILASASWSSPALGLGPWPFFFSFLHVRSETQIWLFKKKAATCTFRRFWDIAKARQAPNSRLYLYQMLPVKKHTGSPWWRQVPRRR